MGDEEFGVGGGVDDDFDAVGGCGYNCEKGVEIGEKFVVGDVDGRVVDDCSGDCTFDLKRDSSILVQRGRF